MNCRIDRFMMLVFTYPLTKCAGKFGAGEYLEHENQLRRSLP